VRVNGREYRGEVELVPDRTGVTVVNRVGLESYVLGVVSAEMGRRAPEDLEALRAQSVVSRTYALRNRGPLAVLGLRPLSPPWPTRSTAGWPRKRPRHARR
jgi:stage II sporulation protein D